MVDINEKFLAMDDGELPPEGELGYEEDGGPGAHVDTDLLIEGGDSQFVVPGNDTLN